MKKFTKFYNILFPVWLLYLYPLMWLIILPGNFIVDSFIMIISMYILKIVNKKDFYKTHIVKVFIFGMLADIIGSFFIFLMVFLFEIGTIGDEFYLTFPGLIISCIMIFIFNYIITFKKIDKKDRIKFSLIFAIVTAPYTFLIPLTWIY